MIRERLLQRFDRAWAAFEASYAGLSRTDLLEPGVVGQWSVRDLIVHVTTWEEEALKHLPGILAGRKPPRYSVTHGGIDAFNVLMIARRKGIPLAEAFRQQAAVHRRVVALIRRAPEAQLASGTRFRNRLRLDTYGHYAVHTAAILKWRSERKGVARPAAGDPHLAPTLSALPSTAPAAGPDRTRAGG